MKKFLTAIFILVFFPLTRAEAHELLAGDMVGVIDGNVIHLTITLPDEVILDDQKGFEGYTAGALKFTNQGKECTLSFKDFQTGIPTNIIFDVLCEEDIQNLEITSNFFFEEGYSFDGELTKGDSSQNFLFSDANQIVNLAFVPPTLWQEFRQMIVSFAQRILQSI